MIHETKYAKSGETYIAYQSFGSGLTKVVFVPGWVSHLEYAWEEPRFARFLERLGSFAEVVWFDKRGTGLSDRVAGLPILEERMDDVRVVMDHAGFQQAALLGMSEGGSMCGLFAATYPERTTALVLYGAFARRVQTEDYPWAPTVEARQAWVDSLAGGWGAGAELQTLAPSVAHDASFARWFASYGRMSASPTAAVALARMNSGIDIRGVLPAIHVPTLVIHRTGDRDVDVGNGRYLARNIPGARFIELDGEDHLWWVGDSDGLLAEIQEFLTGSRPAPEVDRQLMTVLFTDIVGSTEKATAMGDRAWRDLLVAHNEAVRRELTRFRGREIKTTGDGFLAIFDGPARCLQCARAIRTAVAGLGLSVRIGVHTGECEILGADVGGVGVHLAQRVMSEAGPGEILVSGTVRDLVSGSGVEFRDRGQHVLKGFSGTWPLLALT
jgi:class 3 adenylate cyclase/alpha-beta hydrolase superfamily lysophospholipase